MDKRKVKSNVLHVVVSVALVTVDNFMKCLCDSGILYKYISFCKLFTYNFHENDCTLHLSQSGQTPYTKAHCECKERKFYYAFFSTFLSCTGY